MGWARGYSPCGSNYTLTADENEDHYPEGTQIVLVARAHQAQWRVDEEYQGLIETLDKAKEAEEAQNLQAEAEAGLKTARDEISGLNEDIKELKNQIKNREVDLQACNSEIEELKGCKSSIEAKIQELRDELDVYAKRETELILREQLVTQVEKLMFVRPIARGTLNRKLT